MPGKSRIQMQDAEGAYYILADIPEGIEMDDMVLPDTW